MKSFEEFYGKPLTGFEREWWKCRECGRVYAFDYQPYSIGNPMRWTKCGHGPGHRDLNCDMVTEADARAYYLQKVEGPPQGVLGPDACQALSGLTVEQHKERARRAFRKTRKAVPRRKGKAGR